MYCWRCKGSHAPASCPQWSKRTPRPPHQQASKTSHAPEGRTEGHATLGSLTHTRYLGPSTSVNSSTSPFLPESTLPCQLLVPLNIGPWKGTAILDSGSSYTLINENVWTGVKGQQAELKPWTWGPLYLADGEGRQPIGWSEITLTLQTQSVTLPCVILPAHSLVFASVVGLDFDYFLFRPAI